MENKVFSNSCECVLIRTIGVSIHLLEEPTNVLRLGSEVKLGFLIHLLRFINIYSGDGRFLQNGSHKYCFLGTRVHRHGVRLEDEDTSMQQIHM